MMNQDAEDSDLIHNAAAGNGAALAALWQRHQARLRQMILLRLDRRLQRRVDPSDILQEAYLDLADRLPDYVRDRRMPTFLWMRLVTGQRLMQVHRRHLGTALRDAGREISLHRRSRPLGSSASPADELTGHLTPASQAVVKAELRIQLQQALNGMDPIDREIIALRHFEELTNGEVALILGLSKATASKRYVRALTRLQAVLKAMSYFRDTETGYVRHDLN